MPVQGPQWSEVLCCSICYHLFDGRQYLPVSLACGHCACRACLLKLRSTQCPFDQTPLTIPVADLPTNLCLLKIVGATVRRNCGDETQRLNNLLGTEIELYRDSESVMCEMVGYLRKAQSEKGGSVWSPVLSRPLQRKLVTLICCQLIEPEGRSRAVKGARSLGERCLTEMLLLHQNPYHLTSNLWSAVRARGCQFLGPAMQEEVLKLVLLALAEGALISRKVLVMYIVQSLEKDYPQASKTSVGHVVQLLYRASCFNVVKRDGESSLMQLKEEFRVYDALRREHDTQIVQIALETGLRISPDQWSALLYGDQAHRSHMQSIIDKLQTPQSFGQSVQELLIAVQRTGDPGNLTSLRPQMEFLASIDADSQECPTWQYLCDVLHATRLLLDGQVEFCENYRPVMRPVATDQFHYQQVVGRYKTSLCRDVGEGRPCPRGESCTFAHSMFEMEKFRSRCRMLRRAQAGPRCRGTSSLEEEDPIAMGLSPVNNMIPSPLSCCIPPQGFSPEAPGFTMPPCPMGPPMGPPGGMMYSPMTPMPSDSLSPALSPSPVQFGPLGPFSTMPSPPIQAPFMTSPFSARPTQVTPQYMPQPVRYVRYDYNMPPPPPQQEYNAGGGCYWYSAPMPQTRPMPPTYMNYTVTEGPYTMQQMPPIYANGPAYGGYAMPTAAAQQACCVPQAPIVWQQVPMFNQSSDDDDFSKEQQADDADFSERDEQLVQLHRKKAEILKRLAELEKEKPATIKGRKQHSNSVDDNDISVHVASSVFREDDEKPPAQPHSTITRNMSLPVSLGYASFSMGRSGWNAGGGTYAHNPEPIWSTASYAKWSSDDISVLDGLQFAGITHDSLKRELDLLPVNSKRAVAIRKELEQREAFGWRSDDDQIIPFSAAGDVQVSRHGPIARGMGGKPLSSTVSMPISSSDLTSGLAFTVKDSISDPVTSAVVQPLKGGDPVRAKDAEASHVPTTAIPSNLKAQLTPTTKASADTPVTCAELTQLKVELDQIERQISCISQTGDDEGAFLIRELEAISADLDNVQLQQQQQLETAEVC